MIKIFQNWFTSFRSRKKLEYVQGKPIKILLNNTLENPYDFFILANETTNWYDIIMICPKCKEPIGLSNHTISIIKRKITVDPSIECMSCGAHFFIKDNETLFV